MNIKNPLTVVKGGNGDSERKMFAKLQNNLFGTYTSNYGFFKNKDFVDIPNVKLSLDSLDVNGYMFQNTTNLKTVDLYLPVCSSFRGMFYGSSVEEVKIVTDFQPITDYRDMLYNCTSLKKIDLVFSADNVASSVDYNGTFYNTTSLEYIRFAENTLFFSLSGLRFSSKLSNDSIISIANGIKEGLSSLTLTLHDTPKGKCSNILGTVLPNFYTFEMGDFDVAVDIYSFASEVNDEGGEYEFDYNGTSWELNSTTVNLADYGITLSGIAPESGDMVEVHFWHKFTADENGDTYLDEFITDVKGWTLA